MTGLKLAPAVTYYYGVEIRCLDQQLRLPYNFVIVSGKGKGRYHEFKTLNQAKSFIRKVALAVA